MKIYVDLIFIINVFFDFILLLTTAIILRRKTRVYRIFLGSLVGGLSILFLFLNISKYTLFILKIIIAIFMCITSFGYKDLKYTFKNVIYLYLVSIILGGALYLLNIEFSYKNTGLIFYHKGISINILLIIIISPILLYLYIKETLNLKNNYSKYYDVNIYFKDKNIVLKGFLDTGNNLVDPYKKRPIVIVNCNILKKYFKDCKKLLVPYNTIDNSGIMECIKVNKIIVNGVEFKNVLLGSSQKQIHLDGIDCILNNNMEGL